MLTTSTSCCTRPLPRRTAVTVALLAALATVLGIVGPARADAGAASQLVAWIGQERAAAGIGGLQAAGDLAAVATRHAQRMAAEGRLYHNPALADEASGWQRLTENVGRGPEAGPVHDALMASASHRANILDTGVSEVGVGTARGADGTLWVAQVFRQPATPAASPPPPAAAPAPPAADAAPSAPAVVAPGPPVLTWSLADVAVAPHPASIVGPADRGEVGPAPSPVVTRLRGLARWVVVVSGALGG